jgi:exopolysaccharide production protein ExoY
MSSCDYISISGAVRDRSQLTTPSFRRSGAARNAFVNGSLVRQDKLPGQETESAGTAIPAWKRTLDLTLILVVCPGLLLLGAAVALLIKLSSSGPVFFCQRRVGYKGKEFTCYKFRCYKFRTMKVNAETESHRRHAEELIKSQAPMTKLDARKDPRLIPLGALLRAAGLDELPQIINVLRGDMSLVGQRPCIRYECEQYAPRHWQRFDAAPGLTGLWQVSGKNRTTFEEMVRLDIEYSRRRSLGLDFSPTVFDGTILSSRIISAPGWKLDLKRRICHRAGKRPIDARSGPPVGPSGHCWADAQTVRRGAGNPAQAGQRGWSRHQSAVESLLGRNVRHYLFSQSWMKC